MNWILLAPTLALAVAIYVTSAVIGSRRGYRHGMKAFEQEYKAIQQQRDDARGELDAAQQHIAILEDTNKNLLLQGEKYEKLKEESNKMAAKYIASTGEVERLKIDNEAFSETIDHLLHINSELEEKLQKSADHATVPLAEAVPAKPPRGGRGKKATQN